MRKSFVLLCSVLFFFGTSALASALVVYENTASDVNLFLSVSEGAEIGEQITLAATNTIINEFEFYYEQYHPDTEMMIRFYENDGPSGEPGTEFYNSGWLDGLSGDHAYTLTGLSILAPDTLTWTFAWRDVGAPVGALYATSVPSVGTADHLWDTSGGSWNMDDPFWTGAHLYARVDATPVPEPATVLLLGTGLVGLVGFRKKFKK